MSKGWRELVNKLLITAKKWGSKALMGLGLWSCVGRRKESEKLECSAEGRYRAAATGCLLERPPQRLGARTACPPMWGEAAVNHRKGDCTVQGPHSYLECKFPPPCHQFCLGMFPDQGAEADPGHADTRARSAEPLWCRDSSRSSRDLPGQRTVTWKQEDIGCNAAAAGRHLLSACNVPGIGLSFLYLLLP